MNGQNLILVAISAASIAACSSTPSGSTSGESAAKSSTPAANAEVKKTPEGEIIGNIPPDSPFAKLKMGMGPRQVQDLIGPPGDQNAYVTGKAWIPYYFGDDRHRYETFYKGQGRLTFTGGGMSDSNGKLIRIDYDPTEDGYK